MVFHFFGTVVPLCTPHILVDIVVEIDMGTQVITHSPNAIHFAAHIVAIYRYLASGSRLQYLKLTALADTTAIPSRKYYTKKKKIKLPLFFYRSDN